jgi:hypothetical protein
LSRFVNIHKFYSLCWKNAFYALKNRITPKPGLAASRPSSMSLGTQSASRALLVAFLRANFKFSLCPGKAGCTRAGIAALDIRLAGLALAWVGIQNFDQSTECTPAPAALV